jgi:hypothetical protein
MAKLFPGRVLLATGVSMLILAGSPLVAAAEDGHTPTGQPCWTTSGTIGGVYHARELDCIKDGSSPTTSSNSSGSAAKPVPSQPAQPAQPAPSQPVQPVQSQILPPPPKCTPVDASAFQHVYKTNVEGAVYTQDDLANDQQLLFTDPGSVSGALAIFPDGTYAWVTQHAGLVSGTWVVDPSRPCGAITLQQGDNNEDWTVQTTDKPDGSIFVSDTYGVTFVGAVLADLG